MGLIRGNMLTILKESKRRKFSGAVLFLGYPDIYFTMAEFLSWVKLLDIELEPDDKFESAKKNQAQRPDGLALFKWLGFASAEVLDFCSFECKSHEFDLNCRPLPAALKGKWDLIIDHGTMEHVFHVPNALANIFDLLKSSGRIVHSSPSSNCVDHGFYMFSPTFFYDYYTANNFKIETILLLSGSPRQETEPWFYVDYQPGLLDHVSYGGLNDSIYCTMCVATKSENSSSGIIPVQTIYRKTWGVLGEEKGVTGLWNEIFQKHSRVVIYGAGKFTRKMLGIFVRYGVQLPLVIWDDNPVLNELSGVKVLKTPDKFSHSDADAIVLGTDTFMAEMRERLMEIGVPKSAVYDFKSIL